ncbi:hypothetical protein [Paenibacillus camelliae]|uniref:hypothetical protein n=1 Tax=Paenibacillus camelliae TaxID=512410 RepID=UPI00203ABC83|nr:hypothetical protein [Paenibacillus camelliae]MCM3634935.1 hypothetical protein [Paenibacillus camelliae]
MKQPYSLIQDKWKWNVVLTLGGALMGAGIADCLFSLRQMDLNQLARGLTIFSAGLTILVVLDNTKTQKKSEDMQKENQLRLEKVEDQLNAIHHTQQLTEKQLNEIKDLLRQANEDKRLQQHNQHTETQEINEKAPTEST